MAEYIREVSRGRTLHLLKMSSPRFGDTKVYLDLSNRVKEAEKHDRKSGYTHGGPRVAQEIEKAREYADYVAEHASVDNLHNFYCDGYYLFTDQQKTAPPKTQTNAVTNVPA